MNLWLPLLLNGILLGATYCLLGLSMALVLGGLRMVDLLRGDLAIAAAYVAYSLQAKHVLPILALFTACLFAGVMGIAVERIAYRPLRRQLPYVPLLATLGLSLLIQGLLQLAFGAEPVYFPEVALERLFVDLGIIRVSGLEIAVLLLALFLAIGLHLLMRRTRFGRAIRAVSESEELAVACGISPSATAAGTFFLASVISGVAGITFGLLYDLEPTTGFPLTLRAFIVVVLGGVEDVRGPVAAGLILGVVESLVGGFLPATFKDAYVFVLLFGLLLWRPRGLFHRASGRYAI